MDSSSDLKCWEILKCNNLDCQARIEPDKPCWIIAKKVTAFHSISNTCSDCIVYLLKSGKNALNSQEIQNILNQYEIPKKYGKGHLSCALKTFN
jgi:hypothetical protein